jgi:hypothetical protein
MSSSKRNKYFKILIIYRFVNFKVKGFIYKSKVVNKYGLFLLMTNRLILLHFKQEAKSSNNVEKFQIKINLK